MPRYDFVCNLCGKDHEVWCEIAQRGRVRRCECGGRLQREYGPTQINMHDSYDWSRENGGKGRQIDSLKRKHWEKGDHLFKRNRQELIETYKRAEVDFDVC